MFTKPCFIRKNTSELQSKLEYLGYKSCADTNDKCNAICTFTRDNKPEYMTFEVDDDFEINIKNDYPFIDCGENDELFLAIAALRDDTDKNQWFVYDNSGWTEEPEIKYFVCKEDNIKDEMCIDLMHNDCHKCTVEELIEYFKNKHE